MIKKRTRPQSRKRELSIEVQQKSEAEDEGDDKLPYVQTFHRAKPQLEHLITDLRILSSSEI